MEKNDIVYFVKYHRNRSGMTQFELAQKAGVGLRFIRELEQGKETLRLDKVNQVLSLFGYRMVPGRDHTLDPYEILLKHTNVEVHLYLKNRTEFYGMILSPTTEDTEIRAWRFVPINNLKRYKETEDPSLLKIVNHRDIDKIENQ
jgi:y4mF family transcriptional regulator